MLHPTFSLWKARRTLQDVQWVAGVFEIALNDPMSNWDAGGANIERSFPKTYQARKRKSPRLKYLKIAGNCSH